MTSKKVSCTFQLNEKDFFRFNFLVNRKTIRAMIAYGMVMFLLVLGFELAKEEPNIMPILVGAIIILGSLGLLFYKMYKRSKQGWELNTAFHDPMKLEFDDKGFVCSTKNNKSNIRWAKVTDVLESKKMLVIVLSDTQSYMIPKEKVSIENIKSIIKDNFIKKSKFKLNRKDK